MIKTYNNSKEFPLWNYKMILQTEDFFYMVKGYESGDEITISENEVKAKFEEVVKDYAFSLNQVHFDIVQYGKIEQYKIKIRLLIIIYEIIVSQITINRIRLIHNLPIENKIIDELLQDVKITKVDDLHKQAEIIKNRIEKIQNDINEAQSKLDKEKATTPTETADIDEIIIKTAIMLDMQINERLTSLYQFGIIQNQARIKAEHIAKQNKK